MDKIKFDVNESEKYELLEMLEKYISVYNCDCPEVTHEEVHKKAYIDELYTYIAGLVN